jgi:hypothetical protein
MENLKRLIDLVAFLAVLATGILAIHLKIAPEAIATLVLALTGLYGAWHHPDRRDARRDADHLSGNPSTGFDFVPDDQTQEGHR